MNKPWVARGWHGISVKTVAYEKRFAEAWEAQDALTVIAQGGTRFSQVTIDYEPIKDERKESVRPEDMDTPTYCKMFCAWKGGGPCQADDCPRRNTKHALRDASTLR
jgi:hypothetical protein